MATPKRSNTFVARHFEPFSHDPNVELKTEHINGPTRFFNPTHARFDYNPSDVEDLDDRLKRLRGRIQYKWRSRDNRKGRHTILIDPKMDPAEAKLIAPDFTSSSRQILKGIKRMFTYFPVWDVSYLVAQFFTWGSVIFVINGLFYFLPVVAPSTEFPDEGTIGGGVTSFVGCIFYQIGVVLLMLEAINGGRTGCFGFALEEVLSHEGNEDDSERPAMTKLRLIGSHHLCFHHHPNRRSLFAARRSHETNISKTETGNVIPISPPKATGSSQGWIWWPSWSDLRTHYLHEIGFLSAAIFFVAATIFWIVGFTSLPGVLPEDASDGLRYGVFWTPDVIGSIGFVIGSYLIMLETQPNWYTPSPGVLGWHIGLWDTIGSIGFLLSAVFGTAYQAQGDSWLIYQSDLTTTWGSAAFLIASVIQWYESLDKHPVEKLK